MAKLVDIFVYMYEHDSQEFEEQFTPLLIKEKIYARDESDIFAINVKGKDIYHELSDYDKDKIDEMIQQHWDDWAESVDDYSYNDEGLEY